MSVWACVAFLFAISCTAEKVGPTKLGMWAWKQAHFNTPQARSEMLDFCKRQEISHIDQHVSIRHGSIENSAALKQLVIEAAQCDITVNVLRGDRKMFFPENHERTLDAIQTIAAFNTSLPDDAKLLGIKFDVEPYLTSEWKAGGERREKVMLDYLNFLMKADRYLKAQAPELELAVDVPFWWDKSELELSFGGKKKPFVHHIQDRVSWIGIMSYRRDPDTTVRLVADEVEYAARQGRLRSVAPAMETSNISGKEAHISFGGLPPEEFRSALRSLRAEYAQNPHVRCVMLHHYGSLRTYLGTKDKDDWNNE